MIGIVGSNGFIGNQLSTLLKNNDYKLLEINRNQYIKFDLKHSEKFDFNLLKDLTYIIFTSAISSPESCKNNYSEAYQINVIGTKYFIEKAINLGCKVIFLSSDAVFESEKNIIYYEDSATNPLTEYGLMKKEIEDEFKDNSSFKAIRLSYVISQNDKFTKYLQSCQNNNQMADIFHPFYRNCIMLHEFNKIILWLLENWSSFKSPFLNLCGIESISRKNIVESLNQIKYFDIGYNVIYPGDEFFKYRAEITQMNSQYINEILPEVNDNLLVRLNREFLGGK